VTSQVGDNPRRSFRVLFGRQLFGRPSSNLGARRGTTLRWLKFNLVGGLGVAVQLAGLLALKSGLHLNYLLATALAVEMAVVHNFLWHERFTWADRVQPSWQGSLPRLLRFNLATGGVSIAGNLALMKLMVSLGHVHYLIANGIAVALCSLLNFLVSEEWVFEWVSEVNAKGEAKNQQRTLAVPPK
jgi:putative flippase GtrA